MAENFKTIAYLLGAGASAGCLPVVNNMSAGIQECIDTLRLNLSQNYNRRMLLERILPDLSDLKKICDSNHSVDTYAKKLYISNRLDEYNSLKNKLTLFFTLRQRLMPLDNRYDNFWAALLSTKFDQPNNLRVLSWNYDSQMELSFQDFGGTKSLNESYSKLNMTGLKNSQQYFNTKTFSVIKLNGSAKYKDDDFLKDDYEYLIDDFTVSQLTDEFISDLSKKYEAICHYDQVSKKLSKINELSFAWEHKFDSDFYRNLRLSVQNVSVLVVIGYSFPIYNRKVDKKIINEFMPKLEKVYLQAPDADDLKDRFLALTDRILPEKIILKKDKAQFVFPNELDI